jgi:hypothetical protein
MIFKKNMKNKRFNKCEKDFKRVIECIQESKDSPSHCLALQEIFVQTCQVSSQWIVPQTSKEKATSKEDNTIIHSSK